MNAWTKALEGVAEAARDFLADEFPGGYGNGIVHPADREAARLLDALRRLDALTTEAEHRPTPRLSQFALQRTTPECICGVDFGVHAEHCPCAVLRPPTPEGGAE